MTQIRFRFIDGRPDVWVGGVSQSPEEIAGYIRECAADNGWLYLPSASATPSAMVNLKHVECLHIVAETAAPEHANGEVPR